MDDDDVDELQEIIQADEELVADAPAADLAADGFAIDSDAVLSADLKAKVLPLIISSRLCEPPLPPFPRLLFALWGVLVEVDFLFFFFGLTFRKNREQGY